MFPRYWLILGTFASIAASGTPIQFQSSDRQAALLELYTSEGCSSCPPAESWLNGLKNDSGLWSNFVPVAFHVDYWNNLGWRDELSNRRFSDRQRDYATAWNSDTIYTPEFVLNGREWHNGFGLKGAPGLSQTTAGILKVNSEDTNHWQVSFIPAGPPATGYEMNAVLSVSGLNSNVTAGENAGRHLRHDFAVLKLINQPLRAENGAFQTIFTMPVEPNTAQDGQALAVWVTRSGSLEPLQAVGGWLERPK
jgi:hypothetical protein